MDHASAMNANILERYLLSELSDAEGGAFEEHYFSCPVCAEEIALASKFLDNARQPLLRKDMLRKDTGQPVSAPKTVPASPRERPAPPATRPGVSWWDRWLALAPKPAMAGLCAALAIAFVVQYQTSRLSPQVTGSYFVASTRAAGNEPRRIQVEPGQRFVALLFSRTDASVSRFAFTLESLSGEKILQFEGAAPTDTDDVQVLIPAGGLAPGRYIVRVRDSATEAEMTALPFELVRS